MLLTLLLSLGLLRYELMDEHWLDRAVEDKLGEVIDRYRAQGKPVNNVGALRTRVAADINGLRGSAAWVALKQKYDPAPQVRVGYCTACTKPFQRGAVSAWLEDKKGWEFCSKECLEDKDRHPTSWEEFKTKVRDRGSMSTPRLDEYGEPIPGDQITITWDEIKNVGKPIPELPESGTIAAAVAAESDEIEWDD